MTLHAMTVVLVGLVVGYLADLVMKRRGYGMAGDVLLGVAGSLAAGALFNVFAITPAREWSPMVAVSLVGGVVLIASQRVFWPRALRESPSAGTKA